MEEIVQLIVNNGLGVASFLALIYFMNSYITKINEILVKISDTLEDIEKNLSQLSIRVERMEKEIDKEK